MVRGLLYRQAFVIIDLALALLVAFVIYLIGTELLTSEPIIPPTVGAEGPADQALQFKRIGSLDQYEKIASSGLFGAAGDIASASQSTAPIAEVKASPTLKLIGTAASFPTDPLATAVIENSAAKTPVKVATYNLEQPVTDELTLLEVYPRKVYLMNAAKNQRELLEMPDGTQTLGPGQTTQFASRPGFAAPPAPNYPVIKRQEFNDMIQKLPVQELMTTLNPRMPTDSQGNVQGITSDSISSIPMLTKAGLQDGDIVENINGMKLQSEQDIIEAFNKYRTSKTIRVGIQRNGAPQTLTVGLE